MHASIGIAVAITGQAPLKIPPPSAPYGRGHAIDGGARNLAPPSDTASFSDLSFVSRGRPPSPPHPRFFRRQAVESYKSLRRQAHQVSLSPAVFQPPGNPGRHPHASIKSHEDFRRLLNNAPPLVDPFYRGFVFHSGATRNHARGSHVSVTLLRQLTPLPHNMHALFSFLAATIFCDSVDFGGSMFHSGSPTCARVSRFDRRELPSRHGLN